MTEMNDIFSEIREDSNNPATSTGAQTSTELFDISTEEADKRREWTNTCELLKFCATGPNANEYALNKLNISSVKATAKAYEGMEFPIKKLDKPTQPWDGYHINTPEGPINLPKDKALAWLLNNTLGRVRGGKKGRVLEVVTPKNASIGSKKAISVKFKKISASNPDDMLKTWEEKKEAAEGERLTVTRMVTLDVPKPAGEEKAPLVRGNVTTFPIFVRMPDFIKDLGSIKTSGSNASSNAVNPGREQELAVAELKRLIDVALAEKVQL